MDYVSIFKLPNSEILTKDFTLSVAEQQKYFTPYLSRHLFDEGTNLVAQKFFKNVSPKIVLDNSFTEKHLLPHNILSVQAYIPTSIYKNLFGITTDYTFPTILCNEDGIFTGKTPNYATFENFKLRKLHNGDFDVNFIPIDLTQIRDYEIERFIIGNKINHIQINLKSPDPDADFSCSDCFIYPEIVKNSPAVYDTFYITDLFLKYIYQMFVRLVVYEQDAQSNVFLTSIREVDGHFKVSNLVKHIGFIQLHNKLRYFYLKKKLKENPEIKASFAKYNESKYFLNAYINFKDITYSCERNNDEFNIQIHPLKVDPMVGYSEEGKFKDLPFFATIIQQFMREHYNDIKKAFPIFERLENIYRLCALVGIMKQLEKSSDLSNFTVDQKFREVKECVFVDKYASAIMTFGGLVVMPTNYVKVPPIPFQPKIVSPPTETNKILVIRRNLHNVPMKAGSIAHSAILQIYNGKSYILEYGPKGVEQREINVQNLDQLNEFEEKGEKWSKQMIGNNISQEYEPQTLKKIMENVTKARGDYHLNNNNCHMAQEETRKALGLDVENPYR